jgi:hypothetical protein
MKYIIAILLVIFNCIQCYSQSLTTIRAPWIFSGVCIERSIDNFIAITNLKNGDFEEQMKLLGADISYNEDFCVIASEQLAAETLIGSEVFIFMKCDGGLKVIWYGSENQSGFKKFVELLEQNYLGEKNGSRGYAISRGEASYLFTIDRKRENELMFETMLVTRLE